MFKSCSFCGKIHNKKNKCKKKLKILKEKSEEKKIRSKNKWGLKSKEMRKKANFLCEVCKEKGFFVFDNLEVHHIFSIKENKEKIFDDENLIVLCQQCHKKAESGKLSKNFLKKILEKRDETRPPV